MRLNRPVLTSLFLLSASLACAQKASRAAAAARDARIMSAWTARYPMIQPRTSRRVAAAALAGLAAATVLGLWHRPA